MPKFPKRPRDPNQLGKLIVDLSVGEIDEITPVDDGKNKAAQALGRLAREETTVDQCGIQSFAERKLRY